VHSFGLDGMVSLPLRVSERKARRTNWSLWSMRMKSTQDSRGLASHRSVTSSPVTLSLIFKPHERFAQPIQMRAGDFLLSLTLPGAADQRFEQRVEYTLKNFCNVSTRIQPQAVRGSRGRARKVQNVGSRMTRMWNDGIERPTLRRVSCWRPAWMFKPPKSASE
jgi:hypothetical protein